MAKLSNMGGWWVEPWLCNPDSLKNCIVSPIHSFYNFCTLLLVLAHALMAVVLNEGIKSICRLSVEVGTAA